MVTRVETRGKRHRSLTRKLLYSAVPTILAFLIVECVFRVYDLVQTDNAARRIYKELSQHPAYASKPWFTREFVASWSGREMTSKCFTPVGTRLKLPTDYKDRFFTERDGIRATVGFDPGGVPPGRRPRKLFLLGGSTTHCGNVPDSLTYASQLQKRLAAIPETRDIEVVNCGAGGAVSFEEVERLEYEIGRNNVPDFCIFFHGINEALQGVVNGLPGGTIFEVERNYGNKGLFMTLKQLARLSVAARTIYHSIVSSQRRNDPVHTRSEAKVRELAKASADCYERNMLRAKEICDRYRIRMIVFLQPQLYSISGRPWTSSEQATADRMRKSHGVAMRVCYPLLREKLGLLKQRGIMVYDVSDALDANLEPIFADDFHVESTGNRLIAEAILKRALPSLRDSSSSLEAALPLELDRRVER
jgi:hypothetical protein